MKTTTRKKKKAPDALTVAVEQLRDLERGLRCAMAAVGNAEATMFAVAKAQGAKDPFRVVLVDGVAVIEPIGTPAQNYQPIFPPP